MNGFLSGLTLNVLILVLFVGAVFVALRVAQSIFGTSSKKAAATEVAAKLVSYPTGSAAVLRRRFVKALTTQHVIMPSGDRLAFAELTVRVAPEDLERLDPDGDVERLGDDAARLYLAHAERMGWSIPSAMTVIVEVDPGLRSGWVPPARGTARPDPAGIASRRPSNEDMSRAAAPRRVGWDVVADKQPAADQPVASAPSAARPVAPAATMNFPALVPDLDDSSPTMNVVGELRLQRGHDVETMPRSTTTVLGRLTDSPMMFAEPEVSNRHAAVRLHGAQWQVKDLGSTNGTTVDGQRIAQDVWTTVRNGSVIALAGIKLTAVIETFGTVAIGAGHVKAVPIGVERMGAGHPALGNPRNLLPVSPPRGEHQDVPANGRKNAQRDSRKGGHLEGLTSR